MYMRTVTIVVLVIILVATIYLLLSCYRSSRIDRDKLKNLHKKEIEDLTQEIETLKSKCADDLKKSDEDRKKLQLNYDNSIAKSQETIATLQDFLKQGDAYFLTVSRLEWFERLKTLRYRSPADINTRFIYRILIYLGYSEPGFEQNVSVAVPLENLTWNLTADWIVYDIDNGERGIPLFIVRSIGPTQSIDSSVIAQARMMAFALGVSTYVVTNGDDIKVWQGSLSTASLPIVEGNSAAMAKCWKELEATLAMQRFA